ncbi:MAG: 3-hydroxybutyryl-CoA dehydrogenase [bacterium]|nr:3-hydroxybutyryl-CoA dehydrogenase [bacterium]
MGQGLTAEKGESTITIAVIGAGTMGAGIAVSAACAGMEVLVVEPQAEARARAHAANAKSLGRLLVNQEEIASAERRITYLETLDQAAAAELYIEAVPEELALKRAVFADLERCAPPAAVLATNTSSLSVTEIAQAMSAPERVVGIHFFNPAAVMRLVEVVRGKLSSRASVERAVEFVERLGKTAVVVSDTPGFVVNRVARPYYLEALRAIDAGAADAQTIDAVLEGLGFKMGPCRLMDLIGLDINLATTRSIYHATGLERLRPSPLQERMVAEGRLGRKSSRGFYEYDRQG